jgi:RHS repeat-associated protein
MSYDGFGNVVTVTDALGHSVTNAYDSATATFLTQVANPLGHTRTMIYDPRFGQVMSSTDQNGVATSSEYDVLGRITKVIGPLDTSALPTSRYDYDLSAVPTRVTQYTRVQSGQAQEVVSHTFTDGLGRTIQVRSPAQNATKQVVTGTVEFDSKGRVVRQWTPYLDTGSSTYRPHTLPDIAPLLAPPVVHTYDPLGRLLTTTDPDGSSTSIAYDHWTVTTSDAKQHVKKRTSDAFGRLVQVQEFEGTGTNATLYATTSYQYDSRDNLVLLTDAVGNTTSLQYDSLNRKIQMTDPDMGTWTYAYDDVDKLASQTDARGVSILFTYDALNRQTRKDYLIPPNINVPTNQPPVLYIYDNPLKQFSKGKLTEIADASGSSSFAYDTLGRLVTEQKTVDATTYTIQRAYDLLGRLTTLTYPNNDVATYAYNDQGGIQTITLQSPAQPVQPIINSVDYNAAGQITKMVYGNGVTTDYTYNPQTLRLDKLKSVGPGGVLQDFTYSFDSVGNVSAIADAVHTASQSFTYDSLNRLATANGARYGSFAYTYNQIGNMTGKEGVTQNYGPQNNRPHAVTATSAGLALTYDANGNLASKSGPNRPAQTFVFDAENRLVEVGSPTPYRKLDPGWNLVSFPQIVGEAPVTAALTNFAGNCEQLTRFNTRSNWFESFVNLPGTDQFNTLSATNGYALFVTNAAGIYLPLGDTPAPAGPRLLPAGTNFLAGPSDIMSATNWLAGLVPGVDYDQVLGLDPNTGSTAPVTAVRPGEAYYVRMLRATNWTPPTAAHVANPSTVRFVYDGDGGRVKKIAWKGTTLFLSQSFEASREGHTTTYIMAGGLRIAAKESGGSLRIYHSDHLGSANIVTDGLGLAAELTENTPFGSTSRDEGLVNVAHKFTGQRFDDETGLYYYGARYYDQDLGRFISPDSLVQAPFTPQSLNRYSYCVNSPIQNVDPSGHFWFVALIIGAIIGAAAGAIQSYNLTGHVTFGAVAFGALQGALAGATLGSSAAELGFGYQLAQAAAVVSFGSQIAGAAGNYSLQSQLQQISTGLNIAYGAAQVGEGIRTWLHEPGFKLENANTGETIDALHNHDHLFVPGVNTPEDLARSQATGGKFGVNNVLVNNPRHGLIADVTEAALEKFVGPSSVTKQLAEKMTGLSGITLTGYSQGGIISASTAEVLASEGQAGVISRLTVVNTQVSAATFYQAARSIGLNRDNAIYRSGSMWDFSNFLAPSLNAKTFLGGAVGTALLPFGIHNHGQIPPLPSQ